MRIHPTTFFSTYSIAARDAETGQLGVAVQTHQMCVGWIVPWLLPGVGAVATQAHVNVSFGPVALAMLREGVSAPKIVDALVASDPDAHRRQVAVVDARGQVGAWTGTGCIPEADHHIGQGYSVQANMMTNPTVVPAMAAAFESATGDLAQRMLAALQAAQAEGGDIRGMQSAALKIVPGDATKSDWETDYDLRVDEHDTPVQELARLVRLRNAQLLDERGFRAFEQGQRDQALADWAKARAQAPELGEIPFWQAAVLADKTADVQTAVRILRPALANDPRRGHWIDLLSRMQTCGMLEREGAAEELIKALG
ncbi:MAG TPA: DUF1028 domain-containing protein [Aggregatilineaceae bacterium]|jgi:uncharacterized Ntn-hydrolase superfamily protein|nr:DUF1028 domain-containing protein [Aggregatilineaceae bacterium]